MIPSHNEGVHDAAKAQYADWKVKYDEARKGLKNNEPTPENLAFPPKVNLTCDCCLKVVDFYRCDYFRLRGEAMWDGTPATQTTPPPWVEVGGGSYWACSTECARILFLVHHQYAMKGAAQESRFLTYDGQSVDLDRVILVTVKPYIDNFKLVRFTLSETLVVDFIAEDAKADEYVKQWKARQAPGRH